MTNVILDLKDDGALHFECRNHSDSRIVCTAVSTLTNVLLVAAEREGIEPTVRDKEAGYIAIDIPYPKPGTVYVARCIGECFEALEEQYPEFVKTF